MIHKNLIQSLGATKTPKIPEKPRKILEKPQKSPESFKMIKLNL